MSCATPFRATWKRAIVCSGSDKPRRINDVTITNQAREHACGFAQSRESRTTPAPTHPKNNQPDALSFVGSALLILSKVFVASLLLGEGNGGKGTSGQHVRCRPAVGLGQNNSRGNCKSCFVEKLLKHEFSLVSRPVFRLRTSLLERQSEYQTPELMQQKIPPESLSGRALCS